MWIEDREEAEGGSGAPHQYRPVSAPAPGPGPAGAPPSAWVRGPPAPSKATAEVDELLAPLMGLQAQASTDVEFGDMGRGRTGGAGGP